MKHQKVKETLVKLHSDWLQSAIATLVSFPDPTPGGVWKRDYRDTEIIILYDQI